MSYRNNMRRNDRNNFERNNYGGSIGSRGVNPWDNGRSGGMQGGGGSNLNADALSLANSLISNLLRNQGNPPSLLDLPPSGGQGYGYDRYDDRRIGNRNSGSNRNRRQGGGSRSKGGVRKPNSKDRAKNVLAKNSNSNSTKTDSASADNANKNHESDEKEGQGSRKNKRRDSPYANIPNDLFYCHMCMKHMWDSTSFENHIKGRSHQLMKEGTEESYRLRANMIRQEAKIIEQLKSIEIDRMKRLGKNLKASNQHRDYCTMCDLHFYGNLSTHRKTEGHLNLKKFLHPRCTDCGIEYANRTDFDDHLLSPDHMQKISKKASRFDKKKNQLNILTEADELQGLKPEKEEKKEKVESEATAEGGEKGDAMETENGEANESTAEGGEAATEKPEVVKPAPEPEDVILDYAEGNVVPVEVETKIPKYNQQRPLAASMIGKLECYECRLCGRFFDTEKTAEIHSRTIYHYRQFVKFLNEKASETKIAQKRAEAAAEEEERRKRQKLEDEAEQNGESAAAEQNGAKVDGGDAATEQNGTTDDKMDEGAELYDPSEATGDDEEKSANAAAVDNEKATDAAAGNGVTTEKVEEVPEEKVEIKEEKLEPAAAEEAAATPVKAETPAPQTPSPRQQPQRAPNSRSVQRNQNRGGGGYRGGRGRNNRY